MPAAKNLTAQEALTRGRLSSHGKSITMEGVVSTHGHTSVFPTVRPIRTSSSAILDSSSSTVLDSSSSALRDPPSVAAFHLPSSTRLPGAFEVYTPSKPAIVVTSSISEVTVSPSTKGFAEATTSPCSAKVVTSMNGGYPVEVTTLLCSGEVATSTKSSVFSTSSTPVSYSTQSSPPTFATWSSSSITGAPASVVMPPTNTTKIPTTTASIDKGIPANRGAMIGGVAIGCLFGVAFIWFGVWLYFWFKAHQKQKQRKALERARAIAYGGGTVIQGNGNTNKTRFTTKRQ
ncbi:hypothetical protein EJ04DRAFT_570531 [Polyplosphaeria fusca]|uniref:Uncharacterized protein n=1 Tax=Polyplosphaeria fusca TaxID=682080 RepID=A0A9P4QH97_9PLEO|nr:hypothetical protein EJ04DRAFT_570531 [Polyplosphaeria fusca]